MSSQKTDWSATQYLKFGDQRTRAVRDLLSAVPVTSPSRIVDLGCGPGNSTEVLKAHYPDAIITGMDSSPDMLEKASAALSGVEFIKGDLNTYEPPPGTELLFSNAVLHWLPDPARIPTLARLLKMQPSGGVLAIQVPDNFYEPSHRLMRETAAEGPWANVLGKLKPELDPMPSPRKIYDELKPLCQSVDIWHTHYQHVLDDPQAIVEWVKGTGLKPFVDPLEGKMKEGFLKAYLERITEAYPRLHNGKVMLTYPRMFVVAVKA